MITNNHYAESEGVYETIPPLHVLRQKYPEVVSNNDHCDTVHLKSISRDIHPNEEYIEMASVLPTQNSNSHDL